MHPIMKTAITADELMRLRSRPPSAWGFVRMSPTVAPSGRVRMKASQNNRVREILVPRYKAATTAKMPANTSAAPS